MEMRVEAQRGLMLYLLPVAIIAGSLVALLPVAYGVAAAFALSVIVLVFLGARSLSGFVIVMLVSKALVDLGWRTKFFHLAGQGVNIQSIVGILPMLVIFVAVIFRRQTLVWSKTVFCFLIVVSLSVVIRPTSIGINELVRLCSGLSLFFIGGIALSDEKTFNKFSGWFLLAVSIPVVFSLFQKIGFFGYEYWDWIAGRSVGRVSGTYQHPLGLVFYLIYAFPIAFYLLGRLQCHFWHRFLLGAFLLLSTVALLFTYHRVALVAVAAEVFLWLVLSGRKRLAILFVVGGACVILGFKEKVAVLYGNVLQILDGSVEFSSQDFLRGRGRIWVLYLNSLFGGNPLNWLVGYGGSTAGGFMPNVGYFAIGEPHNDFIRIVYAYGFVGITLYCSILFRFCLQSMQLRRTGSCFSRDLGNIMIVAVVAIVILSMTAEPMRYPTGSWYLFALGSAVSVRCARYAQPGNRTLES